ncbi:MAG: hypothetical protein N2F24_11700, partial [Deltaproteobacteria bacterium]
RRLKVKGAKNGRLSARFTFHIDEARGWEQEKRVTNDKVEETKSEEPSASFHLQSSTVNLISSIGGKHGNVA